MPWTSGYCVYRSIGSIPAPCSIIDLPFRHTCSIPIPPCIRIPPHDILVHCTGTGIYDGGADHDWDADHFVSDLVFPRLLPTTYRLLCLASLMPRLPADYCLFRAVSKFIPPHTRGLTFLPQFSQHLREISHSDKQIHEPDGSPLRARLQCLNLLHICLLPVSALCGGAMRVKM